MSLSRLTSLINDLLFGVFMKIASKQKRIVAFLIDFVIATGIQGVVSTELIVKPLMTKDIGANEVIIYNFFITIVTFFLFLLRDVFRGKSLGKRVIKLVVKSDTQSNLSIFQLILRNLPLFIWPVEVIIFLKDKQGVRLGDKWVGASVFEE